MTLAERILGLLLVAMPVLVGVLVCIAGRLRRSPSFLTVAAFSIVLGSTSIVLASTALPPYWTWSGVFLFFLMPCLLVLWILRGPLVDWGVTFLFLGVTAAGYVGFGLALSIGSSLGLLVPAY